MCIHLPVIVLCSHINTILVLRAVLKITSKTDENTLLFVFTGYLLLIFRFQVYQIEFYIRVNKIVSDRSNEGSSHVNWAV